MNICHLCKSDSVVALSDFGKQPISNRFLSHAMDKEDKFSFVIGQCNSCGIIQIIDPTPASELLPPYDWITYNEPEGHLDKLVETITDLPGLTKESLICGISFKDDSTLKRLNNQGFRNIWRVRLEDDLNIKNQSAGIETIQELLNPEIATALVGKYGVSDVVIARHILEHAHDTLNLLKAIKKLVKPEGYVVIEVPDCSKALEKFDYTTLWEEHVIYFTPEIFQRCFNFVGFSLVFFKSYPYSFENSLVAILRPQYAGKEHFISLGGLQKEKNRAESYFQELPNHRVKLKNFFLRYMDNQDKVALLGAGHLSCIFINLLDLKNYIDFVVDDNPKKNGLFMPGSRIPIYAPEMLIKKNIKLCLLGAVPQSEDKIIQNNKIFIDRGGTFLSIFPQSEIALGI